MEVSWRISMCHIPKALQSTGHLWLPPQSGQRAASPKGHSRHLQSAFYSSSIKTDLFYCVLKISAPDLSLFLHWQKDVSTALPRKHSLGFDRWMEVGAGLVCCGKYVSWMFLLNWALEKELPNVPSPAGANSRRGDGPAHSPRAQRPHSLCTSSTWAATSPSGGLGALTGKFCPYWCTARRWCEFCSQGSIGRTRKGSWVVLLLERWRELLLCIL